MAQVYSPSAAAVNKIETAFSVQTSDTRIKAAGKNIAASLSNTAVLVAATIETVFFAVMTAVTSPLKFFDKTKGAFESMKQHTIVAANATKSAAKGVIRLKDTKKEVTKAPQTRVEFAIEKLKAAYAKVIAKAEMKHAVAAVAVSTVLVLGYLYGGALASAAYNKLPSMPQFSIPSYQSARSTVGQVTPNFIKPALRTVESYSASGANLVASAGKAVYSYTAGPVINYASSFFAAKAA